MTTTSLFQNGSDLKRTRWNYKRRVDWSFFIGHPLDIWFKITTLKGNCPKWLRGPGARHYGLDEIPRNLQSGRELPFSLFLILFTEKFTSTFPKMLKGDREWLPTRDVNWISRTQSHTHSHSHVHKYTLKNTWDKA